MNGRFNPSTALKRADELMAVNQHSTALQLLHEILNSKRARATPLPVLEGIVLKFVELCVSLGKGKMAREGIFQYRNIAQNTNVNTIETVIKRFIDEASLRLEKAQLKANQINLALIDDLEAAETPESIIMSTVSNEDSKDRTDRQVVTPWLRFLWEAYRTALDTLRNNSKLENFYQAVANRAFEFCVKYDRKTEFRRLCDTLRQHFTTATKYANQVFALDLNDPATLQRHLETRFSQLNAAAELQLWQEGFKSVDDISTIIEVSTKVPKPGMMADYYDKLAKIMFKGENYLFHSAATEKHLLLQCGDPNADLAGNPNLTDADHRKMATTFMVSVLAIPIIKSQAQEKNIKFQALLRDPEMPSREKLLRHALSHQVYSFVDPKAKELYELLEVQFHPLSICQKVGPIIQSFKESDGLARYVKPLHQIILTRLLQQLSQVYSSIKIEGVLKLADFPAPYNYNTHTIERFVANGCKRGEFSIRINQQTQSLVFEPNSFGRISENANNYSLPADNMRSQLALLAKRLVESIELVNPAIKKAKADALVNALQLAHDNIDTDRAEIYGKRALIAQKAEKLEAEKEKEEQIRQQRMIDAQLVEQARLAEEEKKTAAERMLQQRKAIERQEAQKLAEKIANELREKNVKIKDDEILDTEKLRELQVLQLEKERRELAQKSKSLTKRFDHLERAYRKEEIVFLESDYAEQQKLEKEAYEVKSKTILAEAKKKHAANMQIKKDLERIVDDFRSFKSILVSERKEYYEKLKKEAEAKIDEEKKIRIQEFEEKQAESLRRAKESKVAALSKLGSLTFLEAEEERKIKEEAKKAKDLQDEENRKKLDEQAAKQRKKELEVEEKLKAQQAQPTKPQLFRPSVGGSGSSWRDRVAAKENSSSAISNEATKMDHSPAMSRTGPTASSAPTAENSWRSKPAAFESKNKVKESDAAAKPSSGGPPVVGSGKWASKRK